MRALLHFNDDSTLFFVSRVKRDLKNRGIDCKTLYLTTRGKEGLVTQRQMQMCLPEGPDIVSSDFGARTLSAFDAFITCKPTKEIRRLVADRNYMKRDQRPCFVTFQPGLEFSPEKGIENRKNFDAIFVNRFADVATVRNKLTSRRLQFVSWGHPYFSPPSGYREDAGGPVYFFTQAISPRTFAARLHVLEALRALALANPHRKVVIKLRHLPGENTEHVHKEDHSYPELLGHLETLPPNLLVSACSLEEALEKASVALTCTSTAAMDAISAGLPTLVYTNYVENYLDPMSGAMTELFRGSGVVSPLERFLDLETRRPDAEWIEANFRDPSSIYSELEKTVQELKRGGR